MPYYPGRKGPKAFKRAVARTAKRRNVRAVRRAAPMYRRVSPYVAAVINPFAVTDGARIPDESAAGTFTVTQTASQVMNISQAVSITQPVVTNGSSSGVNTLVHYVGFAMRPSMADGDQTVTVQANGQSTTVTMIPDAFMPMLHWGPDTWWNHANPSQDGFQYASHLWGAVPPNGSISGQQVNALPMRWNTGPAGYCIQQGARARPVSWGFKVKFAGLANTVNNINPFGRIFFGVRNTENNTDLPVQFGLESQFTGYQFIKSMDNEKFYDDFDGTHGPVNKQNINFNVLSDLANRKLIGCITLDDLQRRPDGLIVSTGPVGPEERVFRDVSYWSGEDRAHAVDLSSGDPQYSSWIFDMAGSQPWWFIEGGDNCVLQVDAVCHWEVIPGQTAYTLPGTVKSAGMSVGDLSEGAKIITGKQTNPKAAADLSAHPLSEKNLSGTMTDAQHGLAAGIAAFKAGASPAVAGAVAAGTYAYKASDRAFNFTGRQ